MRIGIKSDENLKTLVEELLPYDFVELDENFDFKDISIAIVDSLNKNFKLFLSELKKRRIPTIALLNESEFYKMRELFLEKTIDDCLLRKDIFKLESAIFKLINKSVNPEMLYLSDTFKKGIFNFSEINYITYSSITRKTEFHLIDSESFTIKKSFSEIEEKLSQIDCFYKLDRSTIINLDLIQLIDYKEEVIIFKNKSLVYSSKSKLKELEEIINRDDFLKI